MPSRVVVAIIAVLLATVVAWSAQLANGPYNVDGRVNGTADVEPTEVPGVPTTFDGSMDTNEYGVDYYRYDAANDEYVVYDGAQMPGSVVVVAEFKYAPGNNPNVQYFLPDGTPDGTGNWTPG